LPVLRVVQQHQKQADRALTKILPLTPDEERRVGEAIDARMRATPAGGLILELGRQLAASPNVRRFPRRYEFRVLPEAAMVNAFAIPGGFVYITGGLQRRFPATDPDALLFVIGHEIGHVELGHCEDGYRTREWFKKVGLEPIGTVAGALRGLAQLQFSEVQELEADAFAARLVDSVHRDPAAGLRALELLGLTDAADRDTHRDPGRIAVEGLTDYFRTHPGSWERRNRLRREVARLRPR